VGEAHPAPAARRPLTPRLIAPRSRTRQQRGDRLPIGEDAVAELAEAVVAQHATLLSDSTAQVWASPAETSSTLALFGFGTATGVPRLL
jgi:hypothetical protein